MYNKASTRFFSDKGVLSDIFIFIWDPGVGDGARGWCGAVLQLVVVFDISFTVSIMVHK